MKMLENSRGKSIFIKYQYSVINTLAINHVS